MATFELAGDRVALAVELPDGRGVAGDGFDRDRADTTVERGVEQCGANGVRRGRGLKRVQVGLQLGDGGRRSVRQLAVADRSALGGGATVGFEQVLWCEWPRICDQVLIARASSELRE